MQNKNLKSSCKKGEYKLSKPIPDKVLNFGQVSEDQVEKIDPNNIPEKLTERLPKPTGWRIVILPYKGTGKTKVEFIYQIKLLKCNQLAPHVVMC